MRQRDGVIGLVVLLVVSSCSSYKPSSDRAIKSSSSIVNAKLNCEQLSAVQWKSHTLYELIYSCMPAGWEDFFNDKTVRSEIAKISQVLAKKIAAGNNIEPQLANVFKALYRVKAKQIRVLILGQDPAPQPGMATGLAFSTPPGFSSSRVASIQRVLLEAKNEGYCTDLNNGDLSKWADNGVLLLNMALTIQCKPQSSYCEIASDVPLWERFTQLLMQYANKNSNASVFIFWGSKAGAYAHLIDKSKHRIIHGGHPSPAGSLYGKRFFCGNYFRCANKWLTQKNRQPVNWRLAESCQSPNKPGYWMWDKEARKSIYYEQCKLAACQ